MYNCGGDLISFSECAGEPQMFLDSLSFFHFKAFFSHFKVKSDTEVFRK